MVKTKTATMKAIYDQPTNTLNEVVSMEPPSRKPYLQMTDEDWKEFDRQAQEYNDHVGSLRTIPCDPSCRDKFVHGGEYEGGVEYEIIRGTNLVNGGVAEYAFPISRPVQEDLLIKELSEMIIAGLNEKGYTITKKQVIP